MPSNPSSKPSQPSPHVHAPRTAPQAEKPILSPKEADELDKKWHQYEGERYAHLEAHRVARKQARGGA